MSHDKKTRYVYIATLEGDETNYYQFVCPTCNQTAILATGVGRYGNLGQFNCPHCNRSFHATIDDFARSWVYVNRPEENIILEPLKKQDLGEPEVEQ